MESLRNKVRLLTGIAITLLLTSIALLLITFPGFLMKMRVAEHATCRFTDLYLGEVVTIEGKPYVLTENDSLGLIGTYWLRFNSADHYSHNN